jgi:hypothetical protein
VSPCGSVLIHRLLVSILQLTKSVYQADPLSHRLSMSSSL